MDLEKELKDRPIIRDFIVENDLNRFGMSAVISIGRVRHVTTAVPDPGL
jgi:hypothetical protein